MANKKKKSGLTLMEMTIVIAAAALLTSLTIPAVKSFFKSMALSAGTQTMISSALANARAIALKEQKYAGIRFQQDLNKNQYIIFIVADPAISAYGFKACDGLNPIKLPDGIGVTDMMFGDYSAGSGSDERIDEDADIYSGVDISSSVDVNDMTTFSLVFNPAGKLVIHKVDAKNADGYWEGSGFISYDDIFNLYDQVNTGKAMFYQDGYYLLGYDSEPSRRSFFIYDKEMFKNAFDMDKPYSGYLEKLEKNEEEIHINPYTGKIINRQR